MLKYVTALLIPAMVIAGTARAQDTLKLAVFIPDQAPTFAQVIKPWADAINAEGEGILHIDAFTGGALGKLARSGNIPLEYYKDPNKTAETFVESEGVRYVIPGDFARYEDETERVIPLMILEPR